MKKVLWILFMMISMTATAQKEITKFLGIPVDGSKSEMITKLKKKGFTYNKTMDFLEGEFNGCKAYVYIVTYRQKVWRIMVCDKNLCKEGDIKIRFNNLCYQFSKNDKYVPTNFDKEDFSIPNDEDISYEMKVKNKRYEASYYQVEDLSNSSFDVASKKLVWFIISEMEGKYYITMFYDNEYNHSTGEDL